MADKSARKDNSLARNAQKKDWWNILGEVYKRERKKDPVKFIEKRGLIRWNSKEEVYKITKRGFEVARENCVRQREYRINRLNISLTLLLAYGAFFAPLLVIF